MNTKLTLSLDEKLIAKAKVYAKTHKTSVSELIEQYLGELIPSEQVEFTGTVADLAGIIPNTQNDRIDHLEEKYS